MWTIKYRRPDDTFVIQLGSYPYHVIQSDPLYEEILAEAVNLDLEPEPTPESVEITIIDMKQFRLALLAKGKLHDMEILVKQADQATQIEWEYATTVAKSSKLVDLLNLSSDDLTEFFTEASKL
jgi:hypothetical protein